jgi:hypothetical protein
MSQKYVFFMPHQKCFSFSTLLFHCIPDFSTSAGSLLSLYRGLCNLPATTPSLIPPLNVPSLKLGSLSTVSLWARLILIVFLCLWQMRKFPSQSRPVTQPQRTERNDEINLPPAYPAESIPMLVLKPVHLDAGSDVARRGAVFSIIPPSGRLRLDD